MVQASCGSHVWKPSFAFGWSSGFFPLSSPFFAHLWWTIGSISVKYFWKGRKTQIKKNCSRLHFKVDFFMPLPWQTVKTQIKLLQWEQFDLGLYSLHRPIRIFWLRQILQPMLCREIVYIHCRMPIIWSVCLDKQTECAYFVYDWDWDLFWLDRVYMMHCFESYKSIVSAFRKLQMFSVKIFVKKKKIWKFVEIVQVFFFEVTYWVVWSTIIQMLFE